jgi:hypothetical protein
VRLEAAPATSPNERTPTTISLRVNGLEAGTRVLRNGVERYTWQVPARMWLAGTNELWWHTSRTVRPADAGGNGTRALAMRVTAITVTR